MSQLLKFRFRWKADGKDHETVIEAPTFPEACYRAGRDLGMRHPHGPPKGFEIDLSKVERVEQ